MIYSKYTSRAVTLLALLPMMLGAQRAQDNAVPLKNWASPLYWHSNPAESQARGSLLPQGPIASPPEPSFLTFVAITPCRLVDTRGAAVGFNGDAPFVGPSIGVGAVTFPLQSSDEATANTEPAPCGQIPAIAEAYSLNLTVIPHGGGVVNYVTLWPSGSPLPVVSTVNDTQGLIVANAAIVAAGGDGAVNLYNSGPATADVVIDMNGYFANPTDVNGNTALGAGTLVNNTSGYGNVATGDFALTSNTSGAHNVANGALALDANTSGGDNTASGQAALQNNTQGSFNTAYGSGALQFNSLGTNNTALGNVALQNTTASYNTATGDSALIATTTGAGNTAFGASALSTNQTGGDNIALGGGAGSSAPIANNFSIYIGSSGGNTDPSGVIQIGNQSEQTGGTSIAGIYGGTPNPISVTPVCVDANGILGTVGCGIVAGVAAVSPQSLAPTLQNQLQKQADQIQKQAEQNRKMEDRLTALEALLPASAQPVR